VLTYSTYKILHIFGILMMFVALGGASVHAAAGGEKNPVSRRIIGILHGAGGLISLVAGFGVLARLETSSGLPGWVIAKLVIWLVVASLLALPYRKPSLAGVLAFSLPFLGLLAAYLAIVKPF
jgi:hypothetical protein